MRGVAAADAADHLEHTAVHGAGRDDVLVLIVVVLFVVVGVGDQALILALLVALQHLPPLVVLEAARIFLIDLDLREILPTAVGVGPCEDFFFPFPIFSSDFFCGGAGGCGGGGGGGGTLREGVPASEQDEASQTLIDGFRCAPVFLASDLGAT
jgi:hypothetical protein